MNRTERVNDELISTAYMIESYLRRTWCALPGEIESVDFQKMTCVVQPTIRMAQIKETGERVSVDLPLLKDIPMFYPQGGFGVLTFPVKKGDECLVVFADRCIDAWWQNGGVQEQMDYRCHDLSDGFAFVGFRSQPRVLAPSPDAENVQLRSEDGKNSITMTESGEITFNATKEVNIFAPKVNIRGCNGKGDTEFCLEGTRESNKDCSAGGISLMNHVHACAMCGTTQGPVQ